MGLKVTSRSSAKTHTNLSLPIYENLVPAGFPSPAEDYAEELDINKYLIKKPAATFFCRVEGESMKDAGIFSGDILVVDRSLEVKDKSIVVAVINGEHLVKRVVKREKKLFLTSENTSFAPIEIKEADELIIWGVVSAVVRKYSCL